MLSKLRSGKFRSVWFNWYRPFYYIYSSYGARCPGSWKKWSVSRPDAYLGYPKTAVITRKRHAEACPTPECAPQNQLTRTFHRRRRLAMAILLPPAPAVAERTFKSARGTEQHARLPSFSHGTKGRQALGARRQRGPAFVGSAKRDTPIERRRQPPPSRLPVARASTTGRSKMAQSKVAYGNALGGNRPSGRQGLSLIHI